MVGSMCQKRKFDHLAQQKAVSRRRVSSQKAEEVTQAKPSPMRGATSSPRPPEDKSESDPNNKLMKESPARYKMSPALSDSSSDGVDKKKGRRRNDLAQQLQQQQQRHRRRKEKKLVVVHTPELVTAESGPPSRRLSGSNVPPTNNHEKRKKEPSPRAKPTPKRKKERANDAVELAKSTPKPSPRPELEKSGNKDARESETEESTLAKSSPNPFWPPAILRPPSQTRPQTPTHVPLEEVLSDWDSEKEALKASGKGRQQEHRQARVQQVRDRSTTEESTRKAKKAAGKGGGLKRAPRKAAPVADDVLSNWGESENDEESGKVSPKQIRPSPKPKLVKHNRDDFPALNEVLSDWDTLEDGEAGTRRASRDSRDKQNARSKENADKSRKPKRDRRR